MGRFFKWIGVALGAIVLLVALVLAGAGEIYNLTDHTEGGRYTSLYLPMRDGVRIAVSVALPKDLKPGEKIPGIDQGHTLLARRAVLVPRRRDGGSRPCSILASPTCRS